MSSNDTAKLFRENADMYLEMTGRVRDDQQRRVLHELFEENEARVEFLEGILRSQEGFEDLRSRRGMH
jgi:hypothetical protein